MPGFPLANELSGNVVDLCPVGALGDKDFLYQQRVWFMRRHKGVCTGCSVGCSIWTEENQDHVYRIKPRENMEVNKFWICNHGRYGYHHVHDERRLQSPRDRTFGQANGQSGAGGTILNGTTTELDWNTLPSQLLAKLKAAGHLAGVLSPMLTVEAAYLLAKLLRSIDPKADLVLGPVPVKGEDHRFPGGFVIAAEKAPNRRGVEEIIAHFTRKVTKFDDLVGQLGASGYGAVWVSGGYVPAEGEVGQGALGTWIDEATAKKFESVPLLIVQDLFPSALSEKAHFELPAAAFAERDGAYVNRNDRIQSARMAVRPPWVFAPKQVCFGKCWGVKVFFKRRAVLDDLSREVAYFSAAKGPIPETGFDLKVNQLAGGKSSGQPAAKPVVV